MLELGLELREKGEWREIIVRGMEAFVDWVQERKLVVNIDVR